MIESSQITESPSIEAPFRDLVQVAESAIASVHRLEQQVKQYQEDLDVCAAQIGNDYEQLAFLRTLAEYLDMSEVSQGTWHVAKSLLPSLAGVTQAKSLVLVAAREGNANVGEACCAGRRSHCAASGSSGPARAMTDGLKKDEALSASDFSGVRRPAPSACVDRPVMWVGPVLLDDEACRRFIERHRRAAAGQPLVNNHFADSAEGREFPGVRKFLMVSVAKGDRTFGWLVAINHAHQGESRLENSLSELSHFEFGTVEAGVFSAVASMLATHAHNVQLFREREAMLLGIVRAMVSAIDAKDPYTCGHSERVAMVAQFLGDRIGLSARECEQLYLTGLLHDLGKLGVPDAVLRKAGPLNEKETVQLRVHPERGWAILQDLDQLKHLLPGILCHHERYDGAGYPDGLAGEAIPLTARVLAVADSYDAMVSDRPYRKGMAHEKVERILREGSGTQWDPKVIDVFFRNLPEIKALWTNHRRPAPRRRRRADRNENAL